MPDTLLDVLERLYFPLRAVTLRSEGTRYQYRLAIADFAGYLGRPPTLADLDDDRMTLFMAHLLSRGLAVRTARERAGRIASLWNWCAKRRLVDQFPTFARPAVPETCPIAFTEEQLRRFFASAARERGRICGIPAGLWAVSFFGFLWNTGERKSAALACEVAWVNLDAGTVAIPPAVRKGGVKWGCYTLWPETLDLVRRCLAVESGRQLVWPWPKCHESFYTMVNRILRDADLPVTRRTKCHALRVSHASWLQRYGGDPTAALLHSDPATTRKSYIDPRICQQEPPRLFIPW